MTGLLIALALSRGAAAQTVEDLVAKNIAARGGLEKLKAVRAMRLTGTMTVAGADVPMTITMLRPNLMRQDLEFNGVRIIQAFDGEKAWMVNPLAAGSDAPQVVKGPEAENVQEQADFDGPLVDYKARGYTLDLGGTHEEEGRKLQDIRIRRKRGPEQTLSLDAQTGLDARSSMEVSPMGQKQTLETRYTDYRDVEGVKIPFRVEVFIDGQPRSTVQLTRVEFPKDVDASFFQMPATKTAR